MWEDGTVVFEEVSEEEYELSDSTFACEACGWVTYEVRKVLGDNLKQFGTFPGNAFYILDPKTIDGSILVAVKPISEKEVMVDCIYTNPQQVVLSPEDALAYILSL